MPKRDGPPVSLLLPVEKHYFNQLVCLGGILGSQIAQAHLQAWICEYSSFSVCMFLLVEGGEETAYVLVPIETEPDYDRAMSHILIHHILLVSNTCTLTLLA